jgi:hypothetical protein
MTRHLVLVGAQRSGTTYLADQLEAHPDVALARPRTPEPKAFLDDEVLARGAQWYVETWFAHRAGADLLVEKSTSYLDHPRSAERIDTVLDRPLVLAQLRDPVHRAISHWRFSTRHGVEQRPLARALEESLVEELPWDPARFSVSPYAYLSRGDYAVALRPWLDRFGPRLRVQLLDDVEAHGVGDLFTWLGLTPPRREDDEPVNQSPGTEPVLAEGLLARLRERFAPGDRALAELLGRSLPWADEGTR